MVRTALCKYDYKGVIRWHLLVFDKHRRFINCGTLYLPGTYRAALVLAEFVRIGHKNINYDRVSDCAHAGGVESLQKLDPRHPVFGVIRTIGQEAYERIMAAPLPPQIVKLHQEHLAHERQSPAQSWEEIVEKMDTRPRLLF